MIYRYLLKNTKLNKEKKNINIENIEDDMPFVNKFVKVIILFLVALMVVAVNFFVEYSLVQEVTADETTFDEFDYSSENEVFDLGFVRFENEKKMSVKNDVKLLKAEGGDYIFEMYSGRMWSNFKFTDENVNIIIDRIVLIPDHAIFSVEFNDDLISVKVFDGDVVVGIVPDGGGIISYSDAFSDVYVNRMVLPKRTEITVPLKKLDSRVDTLLISKLVKEFRYTSVPEVLYSGAVLRDEEGEKIEQSWYIKNIEIDKKYFAKIKRNFISQVLEFNVSDTDIFEFINWLEDKFVFIKSRKAEIMDERFAEKFYAIMQFSHSVDFSSKSENLKLDRMMRELDSKNALYSDYFESLAVFTPADSEYKVYLKYLEKLFRESDNAKLNVLNILWLDIYDALDDGNVYAYDAFDLYVKYFDKIDFTSYDSKFTQRYFKFLDRKLFNVFKSNPAFYVSDFFKFKSKIEHLVIESYVNGNDKNEIVQEMIANKIVLLNTLKRYYFNGDILLSDAIDVYETLVADVNEYAKELSVKNAFMKKFESQLNKLSNLYGYMKSPEYNSSTSHGITHAERYKSYMNEKSVFLNFITVSDEITGEIVSELTVDDIKADIVSLFETVPDVLNLTIGQINDIHQRDVDVSGYVLEYPFSAILDRDSNLIREIYVYGDLIVEAPISVKTLPVALSKKFAKKPVEKVGDEDDEEYVVESATQRLAKNYLIKKLHDVHIEVDDTNVLFVGGVIPTYRVSNVTLLGNVKDIVDEDDNMIVEASFDFEITGEVVKNLVLKIGRHIVPLDGEFKIVDLPDLMINDYSFSDDVNDDNTGDVKRTRR